MTDETGKSRFQQFNWLIGEWSGYGQFTNRITYIHKRFEYQLGGVLLVEKTLDIIRSDEPTTEYELHQDVVYYLRIQLL